MRLELEKVNFKVSEISIGKISEWDSEMNTLSLIISFLIEILHFWNT